MAHEVACQVYSPCNGPYQVARLNLHTYIHTYTYFAPTFPINGGAWSLVRTPPHRDVPYTRSTGFENTKIRL